MYFLSLGVKGLKRTRLWVKDESGQTGAQSTFSIALIPLSDTK